jgi:hypothetical protein
MIAFVCFAIPQAHASNLTGEALAYACQGNVLDMKRKKTQKQVALSLMPNPLIFGFEKYVPVSLLQDYQQCDLRPRAWAT